MKRMLYGEQGIECHAFGTKKIRLGFAQNWGTMILEKRYQFLVIQGFE